MSVDLVRWKLATLREAAVSRRGRDAGPALTPRTTLKGARVRITSAFGSMSGQEGEIVGGEGTFHPTVKFDNGVTKQIDGRRFQLLNKHAPDDDAGQLTQVEEYARRQGIMDFDKLKALADSGLLTNEELLDEINKNPTLTVSRKPGETDGQLRQRLSEQLEKATAQDMVTCPACNGVGGWTGINTPFVVDCETCDGRGVVARGTKPKPIGRSDAPWRF
jgi:hypothetical protein